MSNDKHSQLGFSSDELEAVLQRAEQFVDDLGSMKLEPSQFVTAIAIAVSTAAHRTGQPLLFYELIALRLEGQLEDQISYEAANK
ncbi:MAG: hypothetical protein Aurels2KO_53790 [Aureliella sp.]